jgi:hypothetical protein
MYRTKPRSAELSGGLRDDAVEIAVPAHSIIYCVGLPVPLRS